MGEFFDGQKEKSRSKVSGLMLSKSRSRYLTFCVLTLEKIPGGR